MRKFLLNFTFVFMSAFNSFVSAGAEYKDLVSEIGTELRESDDASKSLKTFLTDTSTEELTGIFDILNKLPAFKQAMAAQVHPKYTLEEHVRRILGSMSHFLGVDSDAEKSLAYNDKNEAAVTPDEISNYKQKLKDSSTIIRDWVIFFISHDLGKPQSQTMTNPKNFEKLGERARQSLIEILERHNLSEEDFLKGVVKQTIRSLAKDIELPESRKAFRVIAEVAEMDESKIKLFESLLEHDSFGEYISGLASLVDATASCQKSVKNSGVTAHEWLNAASFYNFFDAGAYHTNKRKLFTYVSVQLDAPDQFGKMEKEVYSATLLPEVLQKYELLVENLTKFKI